MPSSSWRWRLHSGQMGGRRDTGYDMALASAYILFDEDGSLEGEICLLTGDNVPFIARRSKTSSTAC